MNAIALFIVVALTAVGGLFMPRGNLGLAIGFWAVAAIVSQSLKMADTWQKFVVLRAGKLLRVRGPGLYLIIPVHENELLQTELKRLPAGVFPIRSIERSLASARRYCESAAAAGACNG